MRILLRTPSNQSEDSAAIARPRFLQIADNIRAQIKSGALAVHDILPSERSISEKFGVSRMTGRRALEALETEGLVYNADRRGRFVSPKRISYNISDMVSFLADAQTRDIDLKIDVVATAQDTADTDMARTLERPAGCEIIEYTRLFHSGDHPVFIETEYLIADRFPDFLEHDLGQSTTQIQKEFYNISATTGDIVIRMRGVKPHESQLLNIAASHTVIELEQVTRDADGIAFSFGRQVWRGEMAEFSAQAVVTGQQQDRK